MSYMETFVAKTHPMLSNLQTATAGTPQKRTPLLRTVTSKVTIAWRRSIVGRYAYKLPDLWLKLRMLRLYRFYFTDWYKDVWKQDPDAQVCCSGYMCGCYGSCYYEMWKAMLKWDT